MSLISTLKDWELLDMAEGLRYPTTLERELAKRLRQLLEEKRKIETTHEEQPKHA